LAHKTPDLETLLPAVFAFLAFSLCASSIYVINDLLDLDSDRQDPFKCNRPFASGTVQIKSGLLFVPVLLGGSLLMGALFLPPLFNAVVGLYVLLNTAYSLYLKRLPIVDVLLLAASYSIRVVSGGIAVSVPISPWTLAFAVFFFVSLAFMKRYGELRIMRELKQKQSNGRGYVVDDMELLTSIGPASGYLSVLVLALYINSQEVVALYQQPSALWVIGLVLLYWITRMWFLAHRGEMSYDPVVFAIKDPVRLPLSYLQHRSSRRMIPSSNLA
jgi:4-hydroxybenzoate polyprenyltransferase